MPKSTKQKEREDAILNECVVLAYGLLSSVVDINDSQGVARAVLNANLAVAELGRRRSSEVKVSKYFRVDSMDIVATALWCAVSGSDPQDSDFEIAPYCAGGAVFSGFAAAHVLLEAMSTLSCAEELDLYGGCDFDSAKEAVQRTKGQE